jgi:threonine/homoserine/homoserine lactone efflux protein
MEANIPWADILPAAVAVAISPVPIAAVILALFSRRPRLNGVTFLAGWVAGLVAITVFVLLLVDVANITHGRAGSQLGAQLKLAGGLLFFALAGLQWLRRPKKDEEHKLPAWTARIESFAPWQTLLVALALCIVNPKNLALVLSVILALGDAGLWAWQAWLALGIFILLGCVTIAIPVLYRLFAGQRADERLAHWKQWLLANSTTVMVVVFVLIGAALVGRGLEALW